MIKDEYKETKSRMDQAVARLTKELAQIRTGRASLSIFDDVKVDYYGQMTPLNQVAGLANPEPNMITIQPWEASTIPAIEKAILAANLGFTPNSDGNMIRISVPPLTEERRKEYAKLAHKHGEDAKNAVRGVRRDVNDHVKKMEKDKELSQDEMHRALDEVQKITDMHCESIDKMVADKEKDILTL